MKVNILLKIKFLLLRNLSQNTHKFVVQVTDKMSYLNQLFHYLNKKFSINE
jgi:hypothetical protein